MVGVEDLGYSERLVLQRGILTVQDAGSSWEKVMTLLKLKRSFSIRSWKGGTVLEFCVIGPLNRFEKVFLYVGLFGLADIFAA